MTRRMLFVDLENIHKIDASQLRIHTHVMVFYGAAQAKVRKKLEQQSRPEEQSWTWIKISGQGRNALDFHIACYMGEILSADPIAHAVVLRQAGGQGKADLWRLSPQSAGWVARLAFPVSSDPVHTPGGSVGVLMNPNTPNDDITGKVASCEVRLRRYLRRSRP